MPKEIIRLLRADEIECRIATISEKGLSLLLYKDARVDQRILDESFGPFRWRRSHQSIDGNLYCTVEIQNKETGEWVAKQDVGTTGFTEKEKSQASDSFKRACFNWGIGRELYSAPFIWISADKCNIQRRGDKFSCYDRFSVSEIEYNEKREITSLRICNEAGYTVYEKAVPKAKERKALTKGQLQQFNDELKRTGVELDEVRKRYPIEEPDKMGQDVYERVMNALRKTQSAKAA